MRQALSRMAVEIGFVNLFHDAGLQAIAHRSQTYRFRSHFLLAQFAGLAESDDHRHRQSAGAHAALVSAAVHLRGDPHAGVLLSDIEGADTFRAIDLMGRKRHQVDPHILHIDRDFADALRRIAMEEHALFLGDLADFLHRVNRADFIVGEHHGDQDRFVRDRLPHVFRIHHAEFIHREIGDGRLALRFEGLGGVDDGAVFGGGGDDVVALLLVHLQHALDGQIVRFSRAAGEDDFFGISLDQLRDLLAGVFNRFFCRPAEGMVAAGGVAELLDEVGQHGLQHPGIHRGG